MTNEILLRGKRLRGAPRYGEAVERGRANFHKTGRVSPRLIPGTPPVI
jgi:hypothetical protein